MIKRAGKWMMVGVYALVFGELFFRIMAPQPLMPRYVTDGGDGIRQNIAGAVYHQNTPEVSVEVRISEQGIRRDTKLEIPKPDGVKRIVLLGDSFFMGYEVDLEHSLAWLVEQDLSARGHAVEIVNLAVSGFGTAENLLALTKRGLQYEPDLVVMQWHATDPADNRRSGLFKINDGPTRSVERATPAFLPGIKARDTLMKIPGYEWLIGNSHLYSVVRERAAENVKKLLLWMKNPMGTVTATSSVDLVVQDGLDEALISSAARATKNAGAEMILFDVPGRSARTSFNSAFDLLEIEKLMEVDLVSPLKALEQAARPDLKLYFEQGHGHWTIEGNLVASKVLTNHLEKKLLQDRRD